MLIPMSYSNQLILPLCKWFGYKGQQCSTFFFRWWIMIRYNLLFFMVFLFQKKYYYIPRLIYLEKKKTKKNNKILKSIKQVWKIVLLLFHMDENLYCLSTFFFFNIHDLQTLIILLWFINSCVCLHLKYTSVWGFQTVGGLSFSNTLGLSGRSGFCEAVFLAWDAKIPCVEGKSQFSLAALLNQILQSLIVIRRIH